MNKKIQVCENCYEELENCICDIVDEDLTEELLELDGCWHDEDCYEDPYMGFDSSGEINYDDF